MMFIKKRLFTSVIFTLLFSLAPIICQQPAGTPNGNAIPAGAPMPATPAEKPLTESEIKELEKQLEDALEAEIEKAKQQMTSEQRALFDKTMEKLEQMDPQDIERLGNAMMTGDTDDPELDRILNDVFGDLEPAGAPTEEIPAGTPETATPAEPAKKEQPKSTSKQEAALAVIDNLINSTNSFLHKATQTTELPAKIKRWKRDKKIAWENIPNWNTFKADIEKLVQRLYKFKDLDPETKAYRHLDNLLADQTLYNNILDLQQLLAQEEPKIEMPELEKIKMTKATNQAFRNVISGYINALYKQKLPQSLDTLFEKFEPTAKKLREEEEKTTKKALEESKKPRKVVPIKSAGTPPLEDFDFGDYTPSYDYGVPSYYPTTTPSYGPITTPSETRQPAGAKPGAGAGKPAEAKAGEEKDKDKEGKKEDKEDKDKKDKDKDKGKAAPMPPKPTKPVLPAKEEKEIKSLMTKIAGDLKDAVYLMQKNKALMNLQKHLSDEKAPVDNRLADYLPDIIENLNSTIDGIKELQKKIQAYPPQVKMYYKKELATQLEEHKDALKAVIEQLQAVKNNWSEIQSKITPEKRTAYFGETLSPLEENIQEYLAAHILGAKDEEKKYLDAVIAEYSAPTFKNALNDLQKAIDRKDKNIDKYKVAVEQEVEKYKAAQAEKKKKEKPEEKEIKKPTILDLPQAIEALQKAIIEF